MARYLMQRPGRQYKAKVLSWMRQDLGLARAMVHEIALETLVYVHIASPGDTIDVVCTFADPFSPLIRMEQVLPDKKPRPAQEGGE